MIPHNCLGMVTQYRDFLTPKKKSDHQMALKNGGQVRIGPTRKQ